MRFADTGICPSTEMYRHRRVVCYAAIIAVEKFVVRAFKDQAAIDSKVSRSSWLLFSSRYA